MNLLAKSAIAVSITAVAVAGAATSAIAKPEVRAGEINSTVQVPACGTATFKGTDHPDKVTVIVVGDPIDEFCEEFVTLDLGKGNDTLNVTVSTTRTHVTANGGPGNDKLNGGRGPDTLNGGAGKDKIDGKGSVDVIKPGGGKDTIKINEGEMDAIFNAGDDVLKAVGH